jgi:hypothetical protein
MAQNTAGGSTATTVSSPLTAIDNQLIFALDTAAVNAIRLQPNNNIERNERSVVRLGTGQIREADCGTVQSCNISVPIDSIAYGHITRRSPETQRSHARTVNRRGKIAGTSEPTPWIG